MARAMADIPLLELMLSRSGTKMIEDLPRTRGKSFSHIETTRWNRPVESIR